MFQAGEDFPRTALIDIAKFYAFVEYSCLIFLHIALFASSNLPLARYGLEVLHKLSMRGCIMGVKLSCTVWAGRLSSGFGRESLHLRSVLMSLGMFQIKQWSSVNFTLFYYSLILERCRSA